MVREVLLLFEAAGTHVAHTKEVRAQLVEMTRSFLVARLADSPPDIPLLIEAILEAESEGIMSAHTTEARTLVSKLVRPSSINFI